MGVVATLRGRPGHPAALGDPEAAVARAASLPLRYRPRSGHHYSDLGFQLLGALVASVHGTDLRTAIADLVTGPLGLPGVDTGLSRSRTWR